jgi:hypothetical protein
MRIGGQLAVHLVKDGVTQSFMPGDEVPEWAAKLITNPNVLAVDDVASDEPSGSSEAASDDDAPPPRYGKGSAQKAWAAYAVAHGVDVDDDTPRDEIIAACEDAEVPVD